MLLALAVAGCGATPSPPASTKPAIASAAASLDRTTLANGQPHPGDLELAMALAGRYEHALAIRDWETAWNSLAPEQQAASPGRDAFIQERTESLVSTRGQYNIRFPTHAAAMIRQWVVPEDGTMPIYPATPDYDRAFLVEVDFPTLAGNNAGWEELLVAPTAAGPWVIWWLR